MIDVLCMGDVMIDFTPAGFSEKGYPLYERNPGGAPANLAVTVSLLGGTSGFLGAVDNGVFGHFLKTVLDQYKVDTSAMKFTEEADTRVVYISLDENGNRSMQCPKGPFAEYYYYEDDVNEKVIANTKICHFASTTLFYEPSRSAQIRTAEIAKQNGVTVSFDPNYNMASFVLAEGQQLSDNQSREMEENRAMILDFLRFVDILKVSDADVEFLTGEADYRKGAKKLLDENDFQLLVVTLGPKGCYYNHGGTEGWLPTYDTKVVDTTGSGDAFTGGLYYQLTRKDRVSVKEESTNTIEEMLKFANACGATAATKRGGMPSVTGIEEVLLCMQRTPLLMLP